MYVGGSILKSYQDLLKRYIRESGLSLSEISNKLKNMGFSTDKSYVSKLQNGKIPPAGDELTSAIAEITGGSVEKLLIASYVDKAPEEIKKFIKEVDSINDLLNSALKTVFTFFSPFQILSDDYIQKLIESNFNVYDSEEFSNEVFEKFSVSEKWNLYALATQNIDVYQKFTQDGRVEFLIDGSNFSQEEFLLKVDNKASDILIADTENNETSILSNNKIEIPILRNIYAGKFYSENNLQGYVEINPTILNGKKGTLLKVHDDGMIDDDIKKGDKVLVILDMDIQPTDICVIAIKNQPAIVRRAQFFENYCIIRPNNSGMHLSVYKKNEISVIGKVIEVWKKRKV